MSLLSSVLLKSDLHFARKVRSRFCSQRQKATEREKGWQRMRSFVHPLRSVLPFSGRWRRRRLAFARDNEIEREAPGDFDGLCEVYGMPAWADAISPLLMHIQKFTVNENAEKPPRREDLQSAPHLILRAWINCARIDRESDVSNR